MFHTPPRGRTRYFQMNTIAPPEIIPASAPCQFERLQKRANNTTGPNTVAKTCPCKGNDAEYRTVRITGNKSGDYRDGKQGEASCVHCFFLVSRFGNSVAEKVGRYGGG